MSGVSFVKNNFQIRSGTKIYDKKTSSAVGLTREKIKDANSRDAFVDANLLVGDFIMRVFPDKNLQTDYMFDDFLASAKISKAMDVSSPDFSPFLAIVNIPEITHIPTPTSNDGSADFNRKIRDIVVTLGVFKLYNYTGYEFAEPNFGDPVQVTFKDMDTFSDPIFIRPLKTGVVNFPGAPNGFGNGSGYYDDCGGKPNVVTSVPRQSTTPSTFITSDKKINKFITSLNQVDILEGNTNFATKTGTGPENANTKYKIVIPKNINKKEPVNIFLYFHGDGNSGKPEDLITKGPSFIPDGYNSVVIWPYLNSKPSSETKYTVTPPILDEVFKYGLTGGVDSVFTLSHSGGGGPHGYFLKQLAEKGIFNDLISASRFLDSDYNFTSITELFGGLASGAISAIDQSRITFVVGLKHSSHKRAPWKMATGKSSQGENERWKNVYQSGTRTIQLNVGHMICAYQVGPEYLFPEVASVSKPASTGAKPTPNDKSEQNAGNEADQSGKSTGDQQADELKNKGVGQAKADPKSDTGATNFADEAAKSRAKLEDVKDKITLLEKDKNEAVSYRKDLESKLDQFKEKYPDGNPPGMPSAYSTDSGFTLGEYEDLIEQIGKADAKIESYDEQLGELQLDKEDAELYVERDEKRAAAQAKAEANTPNVSNPPAPTQSNCPPGGYYGTPAPPPYPDDLKWVKMTDFAPRVWQIKGTSYHGWGTVRMQKFLKGLNNVKGGEDLGKGYTNPVGGKKLAVPPGIKSGWWFGDISKGRAGGDTWNRHLTHQSGIGVDISIPTKNVVNGRTYRGMNLRTNPLLTKKGKTSENSPKFWGMKGTPSLTREYIDEVALMDFLKYAIPKCERILFGKDQLSYAIELMESWSRQGKNGWSLNSRAYLEAYWYGREWATGKPKEVCRLYGDDPVHNNHFHIRLRGEGIAPGPFLKGRTTYPKDMKPGLDSKGGKFGTVRTKRNQGNGQVDPGQPGYTEPKTTYKKDAAPNTPAAPKK